MCLPTGVIVSDSLIPGPGQMTESEFSAVVRSELNAAGQWMVTEQIGIAEGQEAQEPGLGDMYVAGIEQQAQRTGKTIEQLVSETVQASMPTALDYIDALLATVPEAFARNRAAIEEMMRAPPEPEVPAVDTGGGARPGDELDAGVPLPAGIPEPEPPQDELEVRQRFPEISQPLAAGLAPIPHSLWGPLSTLLQGTIFQAIISAGYLAGRPPPAHPAALVNRGGGALGRRRTDLRDPPTGAVIEIKPKGSVGGATQLAAYVATLGPPWHEALDIPHEAWPVTGTEARYPLNTFGINLTLVALERVRDRAGHALLRAADHARQPRLRADPRTAATPPFPLSLPSHRVA